VDKVAARPNPPRQDGDIHIAGRDIDLGFMVVAEIMNAKDEGKAIEAARRAEGTQKPVPIAGAWRLWCERGSNNVYIQGDNPEPATTTNPSHVFEIHPVTRVGEIQTLGSFRPINGFVPKEAHTAFTHYQSLPCRIIPGPTTTTVVTSMAGYNYVEFVLEVGEAVQEVEDGRLITAKVRDLRGELLVDQCRMVFVKDTPPERKVKGLTQGSRLHALGIPRISLAQIASRVENAANSPGGLKENLPYEIIVAAVFDMN
jgi:hypothetical protein